MAFYSIIAICRNCIGGELTEKSFKESHIFSLLMCSRPTSLQDRTRDSDEDDLHDRDYDVAALANNLSQAFRYRMHGNDDNEEQGALDRDDEDVYFDDESAEVVISSLRLGDEQGSLFTNSNWFAFQDNRTGNARAATSPTEVMTEMNLNGTANGGNSSSDDEVVVGEEDELNENSQSVNSASTSDVMNEFNNFMSGGDLSPEGEKGNATQDMGFFRFETTENGELFGDRSLPEWVRWGEYSDLLVGGSSKNPFLDDDSSDVNLPSQTETMVTDVGPPFNGESVLPSGSSDSMDLSEGSEGSDTNQKSPPSVPSLFEEDVEFVGVELEGTEKAMEQALKEGIVGEAGPLKRSSVPKVPEKENPDDDGAGIKEFNDSNYWRVDQEVSVSE
ncbi:serine/threonine-protein phosphatase 6 regulatory subunit 3-like isoform X2 [Gossypium australe]|uniref:Serine/threonine-protein phosphatase 6 regulatory subunit 3-like isoform X2 n=1 Tax=Gossypium australe TaxID=47621 RepID=A0A5B6X981_9ROSI|nr:serine/threonine-protein phosphatase 6 regulatory subunit 3-like isoform X2 [Gossypium australe]